MIAQNYTFEKKWKNFILSENNNTSKYEGDSDVQVTLMLKESEMAKRNTKR